MKVKASDDLLMFAAIILGAIAVALSYLLPGNPLTLAFGALLLFLLPGYALARVLFREKLRFDMFLFASIGLSVMSSMLIAPILAATPIRLTQESAILSLLGLMLVALSVDKLMHRENRTFEVELVRPTRADFDPVVATSMVFAIALIVIFAAAYATSVQPSRTHVILLSDQHGTDLPDNASLGIQVNFTVEVMNGEGSAAQFGLATYFNGTLQGNMTDGISNMETKNYSLSATPDALGHQKIEVRVFIDGEYYGEVHFWVNVS